MKAGDVIQQVIDRIHAATYMEIGVCKGRTFMHIDASNKIAIDPVYKMSWRKKYLVPKWKHPTNRLTYHTCTSDEYFASRHDADQADVIFVDGLHTYEQSLQDVRGSLKMLTPGGVIIIHDCNPSHEAAAYRTASYDHAISLNLNGWQDEWCGDVWKTVCHLRSFRNDLNVFTLDCDHGLGVVTRGKPENTLGLSEDAIDSMTYHDFSTRRAHLLNLKPPDYLNEFLATLRPSVMSPCTLDGGSSGGNNTKNRGRP